MIDNRIKYSLYSIFLTLFAVAHIASAQTESTTIPEYNGVYVRTSDGQLTQLGEFRFSNVGGEIKPTATCPADVWICSGANLMGVGVNSFREKDLFSRIAGNPGSKISLRLYGLSTLNSFSRVPNVKSIVVRQRNPIVRNLFIGSISKLSSFLHSLESAASSDYVKFTKSPSQSSVKFIDARWGCGSYREKILDEFTTEFIFNCNLGGKFVAPGAFQGSVMPVEARFVHIEGRNYGYIPNAKQKDTLRVPVQRCWNVGSLSSAALATTVIVGVSMERDGRPDVESIRLIGSEGGSDAAAQEAFEAARRAIIRCGTSGFDLPEEKYDRWQDIEMTFNPENMRIK